MIKPKSYLTDYGRAVTFLISRKIAPRHGQIWVNSNSSVGERLIGLKLVTYEERNSSWISVLEGGPQELVDDYGWCAAIDRRSAIVNYDPNRSNNQDHTEESQRNYELK